MTAEGEAHGYVDQVYRGVMCPREACRPTAGTPVIISGPGVVSGISRRYEARSCQGHDEWSAEPPARTRMGRTGFRARVGQCHS